jgi:hypothetical protein
MSIPSHPLSVHLLLLLFFFSFLSFFSHPFLLLCAFPIVHDEEVNLIFCVLGVHAPAPVAEEQQLVLLCVGPHGQDLEQAWRHVARELEQHAQVASVLQLAPCFSEEKNRKQTSYLPVQLYHYGKTKTHCT